MYDANKIFIGLAISAALIGFPVWWTLAQPADDRDGDGTPDYEPKPVLPEGKDGCIETKEFMRANHMILLDEWRDSVVRDGNRDYVAKKDGKTWDKSLSRTCMSCHTNQTKFCEECHTFANVAPDCWDCHVKPEDAKEGEAAAAAPKPAPPHEGRLPAAKPRSPHRVPKPPPMDPRRLQKGRQ